MLFELQKYFGMYEIATYYYSKNFRSTEFQV